MNERDEQVSNVYLEQVMQKQDMVDRELHGHAPAKARRRGFVAPGAPAPPPKENKEGEHVIDYRITGFWRWRTVIVPPNVYVVHTRRGHAKPVNIGQGLSFRFNPYTDAFLLIPAAMQTIIINAQCICIERQGILVQAYVQWIIDDIEVAYRKLDFSDPQDPMRIVNVQLREQAEAAIKDKVATMSIDEVLSDKQPIIQELTHRLGTVAEGSREGGNSSGLGLKIVTVQIKEAVVSSARLWENLQVPFRAERAKLARLAELTSQREIAARELANQTVRETEELEAESELAQLRAEKERIRYDRERAEKMRRHQLEQQAERQAITERNTTTKAKKEAELELVLYELEMEKRHIERQMEQIQKQIELDAAQSERDRARLTVELEHQDLRSQAQAFQTERELALLKTRQQIENELSENYLQAQLIAQLPEIAERLPTPQELRTTVISSDGQDALNPFLSLLAGVSSLVESLRREQNATHNDVEVQET